MYIGLQVVIKLLFLRAKETVKRFIILDLVLHNKMREIPSANNLLSHIHEFNV